MKARIALKTSSKPQDQEKAVGLFDEVIGKAVDKLDLFACLQAPVDRELITNIIRQAFIDSQERDKPETLTGFCKRLGISFQHYQRRISDKGCPKFEIETCRNSKRPRFIFATPELEAWLTRHKR